MIEEEKNKCLHQLYLLKESLGTASRYCKYLNFKEMSKEDCIDEFKIVSRDLSEMHKLLKYVIKDIENF